MNHKHETHLLTDKLLPKYCEWLNSFSEDGTDYSFSYTPAHFTDHSVNEFAEPTLLASYDVDAGWFHVFVWQLNDGDDGGPATVTAYFDQDYELTHATQTFDTMLTLWLDHGAVRLNNEGTKS